MIDTTSPKLIDMRAPDPRTREYVAGSATHAFYKNMVRALPKAVDDVQRDLGDQIYDRMLVEPVVRASIRTIKVSILAHGWRLNAASVDIPEITEDNAVAVDAATQRKALADELNAFCQSVCNELDPSLDDVLNNMLDAIAVGNKVAELVYEWREIDGQQRLALKALKVKPRRTLAFVVDAYMNHIGFLAVLPGQPTSGTSTLSAFDPATMPNLLPRSKFAVLTFDMQDNDPRGTAGLRCVYNPWWIKQQMWPEWMKFAAQFATPSVTATTPPATPGAYLPASVDEETGETLTEEQIMASGLLEWQNGSVAVFPHGAEITVHHNGQNTGEAFSRIFSLCDDYIKLGILLQLLATGTADHQTNASSRTHQDLLDDVISSIKGSVARMFRRDVLMQLVRYNFGEDAVALTPTLDLGAVEQQDIADLANAIARLERAGYFAPEHYPMVDSMLGLPQRKAQEEEVDNKRVVGDPDDPF